MWKVLHCKCPNDIGIQFSVTLRHGQKAVVPSIAKSSSQRNQALHDNSFAVTGPRLWNVIPTHMHTIEDPMQFKAALTNFVKSFPDEPPAPGYSRRNVNSLHLIGVVIKQFLHCPGGRLFRWPDRGFYEALQSNKVRTVDPMRVCIS